MAAKPKNDCFIFMLMVGMVGWLVPGAGYLLLKDNKRAIILFVTITLTCCIGLYVGSIGVVNPTVAKPWYYAQIMNTPLMALLARATAGGNYPVYGNPCEIGQIYTSIAGLLNLLCFVNAMYLAYLQKMCEGGDENVTNS